MSLFQHYFVKRVWEWEKIRARNVVHESDPEAPMHFPKGFFMAEGRYFLWADLVEKGDFMRVITFFYCRSICRGRCERNVCVEMKPKCRKRSGCDWKKFYRKRGRNERRNRHIFRFQFSVANEFFICGFWNYGCWTFAIEKREIIFQLNFVPITRSRKCGQKSEFVIIFSQ